MTPEIELETRKKRHIKGKVVVKAMGGLMVVSASESDPEAIQGIRDAKLVGTHIRAIRSDENGIATDGRGYPAETAEERTGDPNATLRLIIAE